MDLQDFENMVLNADMYHHRGKLRFRRPLNKVLNQNGSGKTKGQYTRLNEPSKLQIIPIIDFTNLA